MYKCSNCGTTMSEPLDKCPECKVSLSQVKCEACKYTGGKTEFISNNHRCPKCNSVTYVPMGSLSYTSDAPCPFCNEPSPTEEFAHSIYKKVPICKTCKTEHNRTMGPLLFSAIFSPIILPAIVIAIGSLVGNFVDLPQNLANTFFYASCGIGLFLLVGGLIYVRKWATKHNKQFNEWLITYANK